MKPLHVIPAGFGCPAQPVIGEIIHEVGVITRDRRQLVAEGVVLTVYGYEGWRGYMN